MNPLNRLPVMGGLFLVVAAVAITFLLEQFPLVHKLELLSLDRRFQMRAFQPDKIATDLALVGIGDRALEEMGRWPWPRVYHADLIKGLLPHQPKGFAFDILFLEPDLFNPSSDEALIEQAAGGGSIIMAAAFEEGRVMIPMESLARHSRIGVVNLPRDRDGLSRRLPLFIEHEGKRYPSIALSMACLHFYVSFDDLEISPGHQIIIRPPARKPVVIPLDRDNAMLVNYRATLKDFHGAGYQQIASAIQNASDESLANLDAFVRGKIVLVGFTGTGLDIIPLPLDANSPGVVVHANAYSNIVNRDFLQPMPAGLNILVFAVFFIAVYLASRHLPTRWAGLAAFGLIVIYVTGSILLFNVMNVVVSMASPLLVAFGILVGVTSQRLVIEAREKGKIKSTFNRFLSRNILEAVLKDPALLKMGGVRREMTVLFADIQGFTTLCESSPPEVVVPILNEMLDHLTPIIFKHDGTLDKYIGDAIMAFWGAPQEQSDHALRAVKAALEMQKEIKRLQDSWRAKGLPALNMGIGINTGPVVVGNMGSSELASYTVIGDTVNLSARLETLTRKHDASIIIGEETWLQVRDHVWTEFIEETLVKGKTKPVRIHKALGLK